MNDRQQVRSQVLFNSGLSAWSRVVYFALDDMAQKAEGSDRHGMAWPRQSLLASKIGASRREVQRGIKQLATAGCVEVIREQRGCRYVLPWSSWAAGTRQKSVTGGAIGVHPGYSGAPRARFKGAAGAHHFRIE